MANNFTHLILDIGGVCMSYSVAEALSLTRRQMISVLESPSWHDYERGYISEQQCYAAITAALGLEEGAVAKSLSEVRGAMVFNMEFIDAIKHLKKTYPYLKVHAFSNISQPDFELIQQELESWDIFDQTFISAFIGHRKPDLCSYRAVLDSLDAEASSCIFVDDKIDNAVAAHSLGLHGIVYESSEKTITTLFTLLGDPVARAKDFLRQESRNMFSQTEGGISIQDNFSQLLIFQCTQDRNLVSLENKGNTWQYFISKPVFTDQAFPDDVDTTSLALVTVDMPADEKQTVLDSIAANLTQDGLPMTYFDHKRPRVCPYVAANVLRAFYLNQQGYRLPETLSYLCRFIQTRAYEIGSRYYCQPEWLLYYLADLCAKCDDPELDGLRTILKVELTRRMGRDKDVMAAGLRAVSAQALGLRNTEDVNTLLATQQLDGGWGLVWMVKYGSVSINIGNRGVTTAFAVKAIETARAVSQVG